MTTAPHPLETEPGIWGYWRRPKRYSVSEWADEHRVLDPLFSAEPGKWSTDRTPHSREWMDSAALPWVRKISIMAGAQVSKSETMNNVVGYYVAERPAPIMFVMPKQQLAKRVMDRRIMPMVRDSKVLTAELTGKSRDATVTEVAFKRSILYMASAQSPSDLASVPIQLVCCDEVDKWPKWSGDEASPMSLVEERTATFPQSVILSASTPTTVDGLINELFEDGDQRRYHVPCPHCGQHQALIWARVRWDKEKVRKASDMRRVRDAWYECQHCHGKIEEKHKRRMLQAGVWVPAQFTYQEWVGGAADADREAHRSYHIWSGYSPFLKWWQLVEVFLDAIGDAKKMMGFTNSKLAEVWQEKIGDTKPEAVEACIDEDRSQGQVPDWVRLVVGSADVQADRVEWAVFGWGSGERCALIQAGVIKKTKKKGKDFEELGDVMFRNVWGHGEKAHRVRCFVIDSRFRRDEVMSFAARHRPICRMIAGVHTDRANLFGTVRIDKHPVTGRVLENSQTVWTVAVNWLKDIVAARIDQALSQPEEEEGRIHLPNDLPKSFLDQIPTEQKVIERKGGKEVRKWMKKPGKDRNEAWDLIVYGFAAARMVFAETIIDPEDDQAKPRPPRPQPRKRRPIAPSIGRR